MMDDGRKNRKYRLLDDGCWKKVQKVQKVYIDECWSKYIKYIMRHFDETFGQDILKRYFDKTY